MYFIDYGSASAMVRGVEATKLQTGDYFGEMSFIATCRRLPPRTSGACLPPAHALACLPAALGARPVSSRRGAATPAAFGVVSVLGWPQTRRAPALAPRLPAGLRVAMDA